MQLLFAKVHIVKLETRVFCKYFLAQTFVFTLASLSSGVFIPIKAVNLYSIISNQINQKIKKNTNLLFMLAYQSKNDDEDKNNGDGDKEDKIGRHGLLI